MGIQWGLISGILLLLSCYWNEKSLKIQSFNSRELPENSIFPIQWEWAMKMYFRELVSFNSIFQGSRGKKMDSRALGIGGNDFFGEADPKNALKNSERKC